MSYQKMSLLSAHFDTKFRIIKVYCALFKFNVARGFADVTIGFDVKS